MRGRRSSSTPTDSNTRMGTLLAVTRVLSCIQPTGDVHLGSYLGALRPWALSQHHDAFHGIVDLHALTVTEESGVIGQRTVELAAMLFAVGLDPDVATVFVQSHIAEHSQLAWVMECTVSYGELSRMTQFKDKAATRDFVSAGLFTYPALQAADILLYDANHVPVGDDQRQHVEITRDIAVRFNHRFGETFVVPEAVTPPVGARVMDLLNPVSKMSKSLESSGSIQVLDDPDIISRKFKRAVTDSENEVRYDTGHQTGRQQPAGDPRRGDRTEARRAGQGVHAVRTTEDGCRRCRDRTADADPGPLPRARRRPRRAGRAAAQGRRQGPRRRLGHAPPGVRRGRLPRPGEPDRPPDHQARRPGARQPGGRAALRARRHGDHRSPRHRPARRARPRRHRARPRRRRMQLPDVRHDRACRPPARCQPTGRGGRRRDADDVAVGDRRARPGTARRPGCTARRRMVGRERRRPRLRRHLPAHRGDRRALRPRVDGCRGRAARRRRLPLAARRPAHWPTSSTPCSRCCSSSGSTGACPARRGRR